MSTPKDQDNDATNPAGRRDEAGTRRNPREGNPAGEAGSRGGAQQQSQQEPDVEDPFGADEPE